MIEAMISCMLISQDIDESTYERMCKYLCQDKRTEYVYTEPQFWCPKTLYVDKEE